MIYTWNEYQEALNIVKTFEKEREKIKSDIINFNWERTYDDIIWKRRIAISKEEYIIRKLTPERRTYLGEEFLKKYIDDMKKDLLKIRYEKFKNI
jgi:hypothetical protein